MEKQNKSIGKTVLVVLLLIVTIVSLILATYAWAKYTSTENGSATATVAKWDVSLTADDTEFVKEYTHVVKDLIAPGTSGKIDVTVAAGNTEVDFDYEIALLTATPKPKHLKFYSDEECTTELVIGDSTDGVIKGNVKVVADDGTKLSTPVVTGTSTIYWKWVYSYADYTGADKEATEEAYDQQDVTDSTLGDMAVTFKMTATQVKPTAK